MTRAQAQVVAWWAPSFDEPNGGLSRLLRGRGPGESAVPNRVAPAKVSDDDALARFKEWEAAGGPVIEESVVRPVPAMPRDASPPDLDARHFHRVDRHLVAADVVLRPDPRRRDDPGEQRAGGGRAGRRGRRDPAGVLGGGRRMCRRRWRICRRARSSARWCTRYWRRPTRSPQIWPRSWRRRFREHSVWWPVDVPAADLAAAMVPMHDTPLGSTGGRLDAAADRAAATGCGRWTSNSLWPVEICALLRRRSGCADVGELLRAHLPKDDPLASYADRLTEAALAGQPLKGYLSGSVDAVLRIGDRYVVVDYKTNWLGDPTRPLTAADYAQPRLVEAMLHSDYPLQALLYSVVLHRFLRWRLPGYAPQRHLGGVIYLLLAGHVRAGYTSCGRSHPAGVFSWQPPASLIIALSDLLDAGRMAA